MSYGHGQQLTLDVSPAPAGPPHPGAGEAPNPAPPHAATVARDAAIAQVEAGSDDWQRSVIDEAIRAWADTGRMFSANHVRPMLPEVRKALIGARFLAAAKAGLIVRRGYEPSNDQATHAHPVAVWIGAHAEDGAA